MGDKSIDEIRLAFLIHDVARQMRTAYDQKMKPLGLTRSQWWVLAYLQRHDGPTQQELADILDVGKVTLTGLLTRLENKGWVERRPHEHDKRSKRVYLTDKVRSVVDSMREVGRELLHDVAAGLSQDELIILESLLTGMHQNLTELNIGSDEKFKLAAAKRTAA